MNSLYYRSFIRKFDSLCSLRMTCSNGVPLYFLGFYGTPRMSSPTNLDFPFIKVLCATYFQESSRNTITLSNLLTSKNKKRHNREFIPSALDIIRLIFRKETKTVVRGCGVGAADSFCIILHFFDFVNSSICTIFNLKIRRKSYKREKSTDKPRRLCAF